MSAQRRPWDARPAGGDESHRAPGGRQQPSLGISTALKKLGWPRPLRAIDPAPLPTRSICLTAEPGLLICRIAARQRGTTLERGSERQPIGSERNPRKRVCVVPATNVWSPWRVRASDALRRACPWASCSRHSTLQHIYRCGLVTASDGHIYTQSAVTIAARKRIHVGFRFKGYYEVKGKCTSSLNVNKAEPGHAGGLLGRIPWFEFGLVMSGAPFSETGPLQQSPPGLTRRRATARQMTSRTQRTAGEVSGS